MNNNNIKELSIQVNLNGLSFCILNRTSNTVEFLNTIEFISKLTPFDVLNRLKTELSASSRFFDNFDAVNVIHQNELSTLVPKDLYDENQKANYLKFNAKILKTDFITQDELEINNSINVYIPYVNINNYIFETFGEFTYKHSSTILIQTILEKEKDHSEVAPKVFVHVNPSTIEVLVLERGQLQLFNVFEYQSKEDFIYYILFVFEQLSLDVETTLINLCGRIKENDELYHQLYTYVRHIKILDNTFGYKYPEITNSEDIHYHYLILNSF
ncbi:DUF3822 family protein [Winogradskyella sp.]|uniref:DUF3822 family protein n=1 Tax=Winogradskyella sp. TaxID=1883156 RepID=UPI002618B1BD|nr:DUF3822 family protein [Winogradskyella sp.]